MHFLLYIVIVMKNTQQQTTQPCTETIEWFGGIFKLANQLNAELEKHDFGNNPDFDEHMLILMCMPLHNIEEFRVDSDTVERVAAAAILLMTVTLNKPEYSELNQIMLQFLIIHHDVRDVRNELVLRESV